MQNVPHDADDDHDDDDAFCAVSKPCWFQSVKLSLRPGDTLSKFIGKNVWIYLENI